MAGYSGTPLAKKLGLREGMRAFLVDVPDDLRPLFAELVVAPRAKAPLDYIHIFTTDEARLRESLPRLAAALHDKGDALDLVAEEGLEARDHRR